MGEPDKQPREEGAGNPEVQSRETGSERGRGSGGLTQVGSVGSRESQAHPALLDRG